jgi:hypothetical protein
VKHRIWRRSNDPVFRAATALVALAALAGYGATVRQATQARTAFAAQIASLSEPDGYFDTDNLISNERSYLEVLPELDRRNVRGGAYIGVGPDQNFTYIASIRPSVAFILDIRRDNLLLHLLFKAIFQQSRTRVDYLALLFGRPVPADVDSWRESTIARLAGYINGPGLDSASINAVHSRLEGVVKGFGVPLSSDDLLTIGRFHRRFINDGLLLKFQSAGRPAQPYYPTYQELLLETDGKGNQRNYLASEEAFQFVKSLQQRDRIIPVVGNLSGPSALAGIGRLLGEKGETLSAFYASNVEFYLDRQGSYQRFLSNLGRVPHTSRSVVIRSNFFNRGFAGGSTSEIQPVEELLGQFAVAR